MSTDDCMYTNTDATTIATARPATTIATTRSATTGVNYINGADKRKHSCCLWYFAFLLLMIRSFYF